MSNQEPQPIPLTQAEISSAISLERAIAMTQARLQTQIEALQAFDDHLRRTHGVPEDYTVIDWLVGFVPKLAPTEGHTHD